jgi:YidC/Oxa1 family membrane protein insertase
MTDLRRTLLWVVFSMSLFLLWDAWNKHQGQPSMFGGPPARPAATTSTPAAGSASVPAPGATASAAPPTAVPAAPAASETVTIVTDVVKATLDSRGAGVVRLEMLQYRDQHDEKSNVVLFDRSVQRRYMAQSGIVSAPDAPTHLSEFKLLPDDRALADGRDAVTVRFESAGSGAVSLLKTYTFRRGSYVVDVKHEITNRSSQPVSPQLYLQLMRDGSPPPGESSFYFTFTGPAIYTDAEKFQKIDFADIKSGKAKHSTVAQDGWVAMVQHYFVSAWLPPQGIAREFYTKPAEADLYSVGMLFPLGSIEPGASRSVEQRLFAGPQEEKRLEQLAPGLELVKDYGYFAVLAKPLYWLLDKLHAVLGNWGWAIVALVVLLKIAFYWLNASAYSSMAKMKAINPRVMELRERHKDNPQQMQQEMMRIYREEKVNPLGGCLPILVQIPFFIALYWVLLSSVEMRNAPWVLWIHDLSAKDPYYILPLVMTGSTLLQTWLNPTPPDPMQARMMWIMPLVFSVMFFVFPAGLVLYWLTNNVLSIAQQWFINKRLGVLGK